MAVNSAVHSPLHEYPHILLHSTWKSLSQNWHSEQSVGAVGPGSCLPSFKPFVIPKFMSPLVNSIPCLSVNYYYALINTYRYNRVSKNSTVTQFMKKHLSKLNWQKIQGHHVITKYTRDWHTFTSQYQKNGLTRTEITKCFQANRLQASSYIALPLPPVFLLSSLSPYSLK